MSPRDPIDYLGEFEQLLLFALLRLGADAYGVTIRQEIARRTGRDIAAGAVYTALERLEARGYVRSWMGEPTPERGGKRKKYYALQAEGSKALARSYENLQRMARGVSPRLVTGDS